MKRKLTLTVDEDLIPKAKEAAGARGVSLSQLVEDLLRTELDEHGEESFVSRWVGRFVPADRDDERYHELAKKYLQD